MNDFVDIIGYEGKYQINKQGEVYSISRKKILTPYLNKPNGYLHLRLSDKNNVRKFHKIHRLIALHFIPNPNNYEFIDHKDNNKINNSIENLRWINHSGNMRNSHLKKKSNLPRGVSINHKRYEAQIVNNKKTICLGTYDTPEKASEVYEEKYNELMSVFD